MTHIFSPILALHVTAGFLALVAGLLPILGVKGSRPRCWS